MHSQTNCNPELPEVWGYWQRMGFQHSAMHVQMLHQTTTCQPKPPNTMAVPMAGPVGCCLFFLGGGGKCCHFPTPSPKPHKYSLHILPQTPQITAIPLWVLISMGISGKTVGGMWHTISTHSHPYHSPVGVHKCTGSKVNTQAATPRFH